MPPNAAKQRPHHLPFLHSLVVGDSSPDSSSSFDAEEDGSNKLLPWKGKKSRTHAMKTGAYSPVRLYDYGFEHEDSSTEECEDLEGEASFEEEESLADESVASSSPESPDQPHRLKRACRRFFRVTIALSAVAFGFVLWMIACISHNHNLPFSNSNFILFDNYEVSDFVKAIRPLTGSASKAGAVSPYPEVMYWRNLQTPQGVMDCEFDFSSILYQGGQGILYRGKCFNDERSDDVIFKYLKGWRPLLWEGAATKTIGEITDYHWYGSGFNFLVMSELKNFKPLSGDVPEIVDDLQEFLVEELLQVSEQVRYLNGQFFHLDMWWPNVLWRPATYATDEWRAQHPNARWQFQLIDFSMALPRKMKRHAMRHHMDVARRRSPDVACMMKRLAMPEGANEYCHSPDVFPYRENLCTGLIDVYALAYNALRILHLDQRGTDLDELKRNIPFQATVDDHAMILSLLDDLSAEPSIRSDLMDLLSEMMDLKRLNRDLVCSPHRHSFS